MHARALQPRCVDAWMRGAAERLHVCVCGWLHACRVTHPSDRHARRPERAAPDRGEPAGTRSAAGLRPTQPALATCHLHRAVWSDKRTLAGAISEGTFTLCLQTCSASKCAECTATVSEGEAQAPAMATSSAMLPMATATTREAPCSEHAPFSILHAAIYGGQAGAGLQIQKSAQNPYQSKPKAKQAKRVRKRTTDSCSSHHTYVCMQP